MCTNCLPSRLGTCLNVSATSTTSAAPPDTNQLSDISNETETESDTEVVVETRAADPYLCPSSPLSYPDECTLQATQAVPSNSIQCPPDGLQLPPYLLMSDPSFCWGSLDAADFSHALDAAYSEVIHWRLNRFKVPAGTSGKEFIREISRLYSAFATASSLESIALKATVVMPILLLQKPHHRSKTKEHIACLERRLQTWKEGNLNQLILEGRTIQRRLPKFDKPKAEQNLTRSFANLMFAGKTKAALDLLFRMGVSFTYTTSLTQVIQTPLQ